MEKLSSLDILKPIVRIFCYITITPFLILVSPVLLLMVVVVTGLWAFDDQSWRDVWEDFIW